MTSKLSPAKRLALIGCVGLFLAFSLALKGAALYFSWGKVAEAAPLVLFKVPPFEQKAGATSPAEAERALLIKALNQQQDGRIALVEVMERSTAWWRGYAIASAVEFLVMGLLFGLLLVESRRLGRAAQVHPLPAPAPK